MLFGKKKKEERLTEESTQKGAGLQPEILLQVKMDRDTLERLDAYCAERSLTRSQAICEAVQQL